MLQFQCPRIVLQLEADSSQSSSWESRLYTCSMEPSLPHTLLGESWIQALDGGSSLQAHCLHLSCQDGATSTHPLVYSLEVGKTVHWEIWLVTLPFEAILSHPLKGTEVTPWVREESTVEDAQEPIGERGARVGGTAGAPSLKPEPVHLAQEVNTLWLPPRPGTWLRADTQGPTATPWGDPPLGRGLGRSQGSGQKPVA